MTPTYIKTELVFDGDVFSTKLIIETVVDGARRQSVFRLSAGEDGDAALLLARVQETANQANAINLRAKTVLAKQA